MSVVWMRYSMKRDYSFQQRSKSMERMSYRLGARKTALNGEAEPRGATGLLPLDKPSALGNSL